MIDRNFQIFGAAVVLAMAAFAVPVYAQGNPAACIGELGKEFSPTATLQVECPSDNDCTFLVAPGNPDAKAQIDAIIAKATACFTGAGQKAVGEKAQGGSTIHEFDGDGETRCALLISSPGSDSPEGVRAICQKK